MRTIVFLGAYKSGSSREAIKAAERLGLFTVLVTDRKRFLDQRKQFPDVHKMIFTDLSDKEEIITQINLLQEKGLEIKAIVSFIEPYVSLATILSAEYKLNNISPIPIIKMEDKIEIRNLLKNTSFCPYYAIYQAQDSLDYFIEQQKHYLPLMVKSPKSTGSKDVLKAESTAQLIKCIMQLKKKHPKDPILVEEYLDGPQYLVEALVVNDEIHIIAVIEQEISVGKRFIVTGYSLLAEVPQELYQSISSGVITIIKTMGITSGGCHLELRLVDNQWKLIEINPRISGGAMNKMIVEAFGINLVKETLKVLLGEQPSLTPKQNRYVFAKYLTVSSKGVLEKVTGRKRAKKIPGVAEVYNKVKKGTFLRPPLSMGHRYGYVLASGNSTFEAIEIAERAAKEIHYHIKTD